MEPHKNTLADEQETTRHSKKNLSETNRHIGRRIQILRKELGMSLQEMSDMMGISVRLLQDYEAGKEDIKADYLYGVSKALNIPLDFFFGALSDQTFTDDVLSLVQGKKLAEAFSKIKDKQIKEKIKAFILCISSENEAGGNVSGSGSSNKIH